MEGSIELFESGLLTTLTTEMMMYPGLVAALLISLMLTIFSVVLLGRKGPWGSAWSFFLVLFLALWTISIYVAPAGPMYWGISWTPIIIAGILLALLLVASMPDSTSTKNKTDLNRELKEPVYVKATPVGRFFWVLIVLLAMAIMIGMLNPQKAL